ncbi:succinate dehydrogenase [ubiquinone] cytochrome b small subunit, mitochondrial [Topomyia yanbarensis]|uniref:succinate dehydrogenase [ubiquinone] cytochrome b small subunit, mitochondrial n=1 Tax=Topomyia yanbarensis TaxID=2498891 RepID=UPI00273B8702|nr:succinate dehydrogenase [ubiquinone] cytochrome b small subunit, mitochondrial [Topomyia yanbarensis]
MALHFVLRSSCRNSAPIFNTIINSGKLPMVSRSLTSTVPKSFLGTPKAVTTLIGGPVRQFTATAVRRSATGNHVTVWSAERALALGMLGIIPVGLMFPSQAGDAIMAVSMVMHFHWGLEAIVVDYVRPILFGNVIPKLAQGMLLVVSVATLGGLFYFIHNDIGIANSIRKIWATKPKA